MNFTVNGITKFYLNKVRLFRNTSKKGNGYYYPDEIYVKVIGSMEYKDATKQELNAESSTKFLYIDDSPKGKKLRKLTGQIKQLYQLNSTTSEEFWKQYIK
jgi:hypothetical protein